MRVDMGDLLSRSRSSVTPMGHGCVASRACYQIVARAARKGRTCNLIQPLVPPPLVTLPLAPTGRPRMRITARALASLRLDSKQNPSVDVAELRGLRGGRLSGERRLLREGRPVWQWGLIRKVGIAGNLRRAWP